MDDDEQELMRQHVTYMSEYFEAGTVLAYGPVQDPEGWFGIALLEVLHQDEAVQFAENDPSVLAGLEQLQHRADAHRRRTEPAGNLAEG